MLPTAGVYKPSRALTVQVTTVVRHFAAAAASSALNAVSLMQPILNQYQEILLG
jgi:hypothetical protein